MRVGECLVGECLPEQMSVHSPLLCSICFKVAMHSHQRAMHAQMLLHLLPCTQRAENGTRARHNGLSPALPGISCAYNFGGRPCACCELQNVVKGTMGTPMSPSTLGLDKVKISRS